MSVKSKKTKRSNKKKASDKLWELISKYVRQSSADHRGIAECVTCGIQKPWKELQAGHFIPQAQGNAVRYDMRNIHCQCFRCNINLGGNGPEYYPFMVNKYGEDVVAELRALSRTTRKFTESELDEMIEDLTQKLQELG